MDSSANITKIKAGAPTEFAKRQRSLAAAAFFALAAILVACAVHAAEPAVPESRGTEHAPFLLVANPDMSDPIFEQTVILMLPPTETPLVAGIVINKPTKITLGQLFAHSAGIKNEDQTVYFGGPVDLNAPLILVRASRASDGMSHLFENVYMGSDTGSIRAILRGTESDKEVRLFFGRAQWSVDQLHAELLHGAWTVVRASSEIVFSREPAKIWGTLAQQAKLREVRDESSGAEQWFGLCGPGNGGCGGGWY